MILSGGLRDKTFKQADPLNHVTQPTGSLYDIGFDVTTLTMLTDGASKLRLTISAPRWNACSVWSTEYIQVGIVFASRDLGIDIFTRLKLPHSCAGEHEVPVNY